MSNTNSFVGAIEDALQHPKKGILMMALFFAFFGGLTTIFLKTSDPNTTTLYSGYINQNNPFRDFIVQVGGGQLYMDVGYDSDEFELTSVNLELINESSNTIISDSNGAGSTDLEQEVSEGTYKIRISSEDKFSRRGRFKLRINYRKIDRQDPSIRITKPAANQQVSDTVAIAGDAKDDVDIEKVTLQVDSGTEITVEGTNEWEHELDTNGMFDGPHRLTANAYDSSGNVDSTDIIIDVDNSAETDVEDVIAENQDMASTTCGPLSQEAESGSTFGTFTTGSDSKASAGKYVHAPNGSGTNHNFTTDSGVSYCFRVTEAGTYNIVGGVLAPSGGSNSFFVRLDDRDPWTWHVTKNDNFKDVTMTHGSSIVDIALNPGDYLVTVYLREDGTKLDTIALVSNGQTPPPPITTPAEPTSSPSPPTPTTPPPPSTTPPVSNQTYGVDASTIGPANEPRSTNGTQVTTSNFSSRVSSAQPGDTLLLRAGTYSASVTVPAGTNNNPITIKPYNGESVTITGKLTLSSNNVLAGIHIRRPGQQYALHIRHTGSSPKSNIEIRYSDIYGGTTEGIRLDRNVKDIEIHHSIIDGGLNHHSILVLGDTSGGSHVPRNIFIHHNDIVKTRIGGGHGEGASEDAIQLNGWGYTSIHHNNIYDIPGEDGIDVKRPHAGPATLDFENNYVEGRTIWGAMFTLHAGPEANQQFRNNHFDGSHPTSGPIHAGLWGGNSLNEKVTFDSNLFTNITKRYSFRQSNGAVLTNNTFNGGTLRLGQSSGPDPKNLVINHNTFNGVTMSKDSGATIAESVGNTLNNVSGNWSDIGQ